MTNPFDSPFEGAVKDTKLEAVREEGNRLLNTAKNLEGQAKQARKNGDSIWLKQIDGLARRILRALGEFAWKAVQFAAYTLITEFCTMILNSVMECLTKHKATIPKPPVQPQPTEYTDPFSRRYGSPTGW